MPKMHQNTFGGRAPSGPAMGALALPQIPQGVPTSKGSTSKEKGREGGLPPCITP